VITVNLKIKISYQCTIAYYLSASVKLALSFRNLLRWSSFHHYGKNLEHILAAARQNYFLQKSYVVINVEI